MRYLCSKTNGNKLPPGLVANSIIIIFPSLTKKSILKANEDLETASDIFKIESVNNFSRYS